MRYTKSGTKRSKTKKRVCLWIGRLIFIFMLLVDVPYAKGEPFEKESGVPYSEEEKETIMALVIPSPVIASTTSGATLMAMASASSPVIQAMMDSQTVEIIKDYSGLWYFVKDCHTGKRGWIHAEHLDIPDNTETITIPMSRKQMECYVNMTGYESDTEYLVWTDIGRQKTHIFKGKKGEWQWLWSILCTTGSNTSPTIRGLFKISDRGEWFYSDRLRSGAKYWVRFHDAYLFHSHIMDKNKDVIDTTLGRRKSNGCVRMSVEDARWFYQQIPTGSTVLIH